MSAPASPRILVVDDSAVVRQALARVLGNAGMEVDCALDPVVAIAQVRPARPDAIVLDLEKPHGPCRRSSARAGWVRWSGAQYFAEIVDGPLLARQPREGRHS